jgi:hypothetical protein
LLAVAAEVGDDDVAGRALEKLVALRPSSEKLNTQEKAWILAAVTAPPTKPPCRRRRRFERQISRQGPRSDQSNKRGN